MSYEIKMSQDAVKFVQKLNSNVKKKVEELLDSLKSDALPYKQYDLKKMKCDSNFFRIRIGKIRIIYEIVQPEKKIYIHGIDFRERAYQR